MGCFSLGSACFVLRAHVEALPVAVHSSHFFDECVGIHILSKLQYGVCFFGKFAALGSLALVTQGRDLCGRVSCADSASAREMGRHRDLHTALLVFCFFPFADASLIQFFVTGFFCSTFHCRQSVLYGRSDLVEDNTNILNNKRVLV